MFSNRTKRIFVFCFVIFCALTLFTKIFTSLLTPIGVSLILCFLLSPLVLKLESYKISRVVSTLILLLITLIIITITFVIAMPYLYRELLYLVSMIPDALNHINQEWIPALKELALSTRMIDAEEFDRTVSGFKNTSQISYQAYATLNTLWESVPGLIGTVVNLILIPVITFFTLVNIPLIKKSLQTLVPSELRKELGSLLTRITTTLRSLIKGQLLVGLAAAAMYSAAFWMIGLQAGITIGIITGLARLIPYMDVVLGWGLSLIVVLSNFNHWTDLLPLAIVFLVVGILDGMVVAPRILGKQTGLHPLFVVLSLLGFAHLYGFWGFILAIPTIAILKDLILFLLPSYYRSDFYKKFNSEE